MDLEGKFLSNLDKCQNRSKEGSVLKAINKHIKDNILINETGRTVRETDNKKERDDTKPGVYKNNHITNFYSQDSKRKVKDRIKELEGKEDKGDTKKTKQRVEQDTRRAITPSRKRKEEHREDTPKVKRIRRSMVDEPGDKQQFGTDSSRFIKGTETSTTEGGNVKGLTEIWGGAKTVILNINKFQNQVKLGFLSDVSKSKNKTYFKSETNTTNKHKSLNQSTLDNLMMKLPRDSQLMDKESTQSRDLEAKNYPHKGQLEIDTEERII